MERERCPFLQQRHYSFISLSENLDGRIVHARLQKEKWKKDGFFEKENRKIGRSIGQYILTVRRPLKLVGNDGEKEINTRMSRGDENRQNSHFFEAEEEEGINVYVRK